jgi:hypothetical protein
MMSDAPSFSFSWEMVISSYPVFKVAKTGLPSARPFLISQHGRLGNAAPRVRCVGITSVWQSCRRGASAL